ncbi:MAG: hypothetical protein AAGF76_08100 [Pseudomonadota bacterium]
MIARFAFRIRALLVMRNALGTLPGPSKISALALLCRELQDLAGNPYDAAIGFVIAHNRTVDPARMEAAVEKAALKVTRDQVKRYLKKPQARSKR